MNEVKRRKRTESFVQWQSPFQKQVLGLNGLILGVTAVVGGSSTQTLMCTGFMLAYLLHYMVNQPRAEALVCIGLTACVIAGRAVSTLGSLPLYFTWNLFFACVLSLVQFAWVCYISLHVKWFLVSFPTWARRCRTVVLVLTPLCTPVMSAWISSVYFGAKHILLILLFGWAISIHLFWLPYMSIKYSFSWTFLPTTTRSFISILCVALFFLQLWFNDTWYITWFGVLLMSIANRTVCFYSVLLVTVDILWCHRNDLMKLAENMMSFRMNATLLPLGAVSMCILIAAVARTVPESKKMVVETCLGSIWALVCCICSNPSVSLVAWLLHAINFVFLIKCIGFATCTDRQRWKHYPVTHVLFCCLLPVNAAAYYTTQLTLNGMVSGGHLLLVLLTLFMENKWDRKNMWMQGSERWIRRSERKWHRQVCNVSIVCAVTGFIVDYRMNHVMLHYASPVVSLMFLLVQEDHAVFLRLSLCNRFALVYATVIVTMGVCIMDFMLHHYLKSSIDLDARMTSYVRDVQFSWFRVTTILILCSFNHFRNALFLWRHHIHYDSWQMKMMEWLIHISTLIYGQAAPLQYMGILGIITLVLKHCLLYHIHSVGMKIL